MQQNKIYRIPSLGKLGGVCVGLGQFFSIDPALIRVMFVLLSFAGFLGILVYIFLWLILPIKPARATVEIETAMWVDN